MRVDSPPRLRWRGVAQIGVRTGIAIPAAKEVERGLELMAVRHLPAVERLLERPEEALDASVLPRATGVNALVVDVREAQRPTEHARREHALVVAAQRTLLAVAPDHQEKVAEQGPGCLVRRGGQRQCLAAAAVEHPEHHVQPARLVNLATHVDGPDSVGGQLGRRPRLDGEAQARDGQPVCPHRVVDVGTGDGHAARSRVQPIELRGQRAMAGLGLQGLQTDQRVGPQAACAGWRAVDGAARTGGQPRPRGVRRRMAASKACARAAAEQRSYGTAAVQRQVADPSWRHEKLEYSDLAMTGPSKKNLSDPGRQLPAAPDTPTRRGRPYDRPRWTKMCLEYCFLAEEF